MKRMFYYGTLCYLPLLELVIGRPLRAQDTKPATLSGFEVSWAKDQIFPYIEKSEGSYASGIIFEGSEEDVARLNFYEGGFHYDLHEICPEGESETVDVYIPQPGHWSAGAPWVLEDFVAGYGEITLSAARDAMALFGKVSAEEMAKRLPMFRARAAKIQSRFYETPIDLRSGLSEADFEVIDHRRPYDNFFAFDEINLHHKKFNGDVSPEIERGVFISSDAVIVLPYDANRDRVLLLEQFRPGPVIRGDQTPWLLEAVAGRIDAGETPEEAAHRELKEESGIAANSLELISRSYPSPGASTEFYHHYLALCDLTSADDIYAGLDSEDEDIRAITISFDQLMNAIKTGEINVAPLVLSALWLSQNRERLRSEA
ncbi:NUDIX domain-containing protein [Cochlodiniinecator piscidefendens]|uniref:NUDIX domain-containing protein n=1 Tax=Cochlodiniinecator piscidefendens TaxID=2715756 RepID=UPI00140D3081|nr:NUDIX domain-containing protein [Cochlodiniinecator piscidefendens]